MYKTLHSTDETMRETMRAILPGLWSAVSNVSSNAAWNVISDATWNAPFSTICNAIDKIIKDVT